MVSSRIFNNLSTLRDPKKAGMTATWLFNTLKRECQGEKKNEQSVQINFLSKVSFGSTVDPRRGSKTRPMVFGEERQWCGAVREQSNLAA